MPLSEFHKISLMISQHWFRQWLGALLYLEMVCIILKSCICNEGNQLYLCLCIHNNSIHKNIYIYIDITYTSLFHFLNIVIIPISWEAMHFCSCTFISSSFSSHVMIQFIPLQWYTCISFMAFLSRFFLYCICMTMFIPTILFVPLKKTRTCKIKSKKKKKNLKIMLTRFYNVWYH